MRSAVEAEVGVAEWPPASSFDDAPVVRYLFRIPEIPARMVPLLVFSFPAGALADRVHWRRMLTLTQWGSVMTAAPLAIATWLGLASIPLVSPDTSGAPPVSSMR